MANDFQKYKNANELLQQDWRAKEYYLTLGEGPMGAVMLHSDAICSYDDLKQCARNLKR